ncbi:hypothetical protein PN36_03475 [Candidatus Thiomargarita nelsonii]|uniref:Uncharacterized protein n=1 Tax=Candidatus Thiomargarita nelsonii TaxID=1003181 RepID=A0A4E0RKU4_9GAMM|nr:hypothetical protein PN36_03475 [Candidatus Thiomargarita nelsonii]
METLNIKLPYSDWTLIFDSIRHYIKYIDNPNDEISEDELADLYTDGENLKNLEKQLSQTFEKRFGKY